MHRNHASLSKFKDGQRVCVQRIDEDTRRFQKADRSDRGRLSLARGWVTVIWDDDSCDELTPTGFARLWPWRVLAIADESPASIRES